jgi:hypothetical protein
MKNVISLFGRREESNCRASLPRRGRRGSSFRNGRSGEGARATSPALVEVGLT